MTDSLEMSNAEMELANVQGELRDLKQELFHLDEKRLIGGEIDEDAYAEMKQRFQYLSERKQFLLDAVSPIETAPPKTTLDHAIDFVIDHKVGVAVGAVAFAMLFGWFYLDSEAAKAGESIAARDLNTVAEFLELSDEERAAMMGQSGQ